MEQTTEERNLLYLTVSILRIWQYHSATKSGMGTIVIPILQIFINRNAELMLIGENYFVKALCFDCPDEVFHSGVHHRGKWRQFFYFYADRLENHIKAFIKHGASVVEQIAFAQQKAVRI